MQLSKSAFTWPFQALGDETRFRVVRLLASVGHQLNAGQIAGALACLPSHLSRHLQVLAVSGVIRVKRHGRFHRVELTVGGPNESLAAAVLSMEDAEGRLADDLARLLRAIAPEPRDA